jgi:hypothetical protein
MLIEYWSKPSSVKIGKRWPVLSDQHLRTSGGTDIGGFLAFQRIIAEGPKKCNIKMVRVKRLGDVKTGKSCGEAYSLGSGAQAYWLGS